jgi:hypothetical protein
MTNELLSKLANVVESLLRRDPDALGQSAILGRHSDRGDQVMDMAGSEG